MTPTDLDHMERLAREATPGEWRINGEYDNAIWGIDAIHLPTQHASTVCFARLDRDAEGCLIDISNADARYIASCSPERILALVAVAKAAKDEQTARTFHCRSGEDDHGHGVTSCRKCGITVHVCQCQRSGHSYIKECVGCALAALEALT